MKLPTQLSKKHAKKYAATYSYIIFINPLKIILFLLV